MADQIRAPVAGVHDRLAAVDDCAIRRAGRKVVFSLLSHLLKRCFYSFYDHLTHIGRSS